MEQYWEWLCSIRGLYRMQQEILLKCFHSPRGVYEASQQELEHLGEKGFRWTALVARARHELSPEKTVHMHRERGINFISHEHPEYPERLRMLEDKPYGLFYRGELPGREQTAVAVVGARMCTRTGREMAERLAGAVALAGGQVVSGAAYGIDGAAQWAALESGGKSYAVLGCGVDRCYPASHGTLLERLRESGGIISELPPGTEPLKHHFPMRNRIISGLSDVLVVVEARQKSGSLITAGFAAEQGRRVMAVPGRPEDALSEGCNELIAQGAEIILSVDSFIKNLFPDYKKEKMNLSEDFALAPAEKLVYSSLGLHSKSLWELEECTALSLTALADSLIALELKGLVRETERNYYARRV